MCQTLPLLPAHMIEAGYDHYVIFAQQAGVLQNIAVFLNYVHRSVLSHSLFINGGNGPTTTNGVLPQEAEGHHEHCSSERVGFYT
ncbi:hypothetical protein J6590_096084 [Homalodisca vitripennis]|nr:hypothetical protein J6590_096084 [Homalodisca vitripennis]